MKEDERERLLREKLEALILARLSVGDRPPSRARVSAALHGMLARRFSSVEWRQRYESALAALCAAGQVEPATLALTTAGKARLSAALGIGGVPRATDWKEFKAKYLPRLFGGDALPDRRLCDPRAVVLAERLGVAVPRPGKTGRGKTARLESGRRNTGRLETERDAVLLAWLKKDLQIRGRVSLETVSAALLGRELGLRPRQTRAAILRQSSLVLSGAKADTTEAVTDALTLRWLCGEAASRALTESLPSSAASGVSSGPGDDTEAWQIAPSANKNMTSGGLDDAVVARVAAKIERAASGPRARAFGRNKVFIASVWESLAVDPEVRALGEGGFKALLVEAHRRGLVDLSRADLVAAMDPKDVAASETRHRNATYHFIVRGTSA
jgi:hypothetical protein